MEKTRKKLTFHQKLENAIKKNNTLLCVGLDPDLDKIPKHLIAVSDPIFAFNKSIIDATSDLVCCYKPDIAFYEAYGIKGLTSLKKTLDYIPKSIPIILDAKRGSVGHTAVLYAKSVFEYWNADAVTLHIFTGRDGVLPFLEYTNRYSFLYLRSSNPSASDFQDIDVYGKPLFRVLGEKIKHWTEPNYGIIAPATFPNELRILRQIFPQRIFLVPGIGSQGGDIEKTLKFGLTKNKSGLIISSSRAIIFASNGKDFADRAREEAERLRNHINNYLF